MIPSARRTPLSATAGIHTSRRTGVFWCCCCNTSFDSEEEVAKRAGTVNRWRVDARPCAGISLVGVAERVRLSAHSVCPAWAFGTAFEDAPALGPAIPPNGCNHTPRTERSANEADESFRRLVFRDIVGIEGQEVPAAGAQPPYAHPNCRARMEAEGSRKSRGNREGFGTD